MCGRFNIIDSPEVLKLAADLGIKLLPNHFAADIAPGAQIPIVHQLDGPRRVSTAIWWLMLDRQTLKPNYKYSSFNSKSDRLHDRKAIAYKPYRRSRCIIPASAFAEGLGDKKTYHKIELENSAIAFGGLYETYLHQETGEAVYGASIITLPPLLPEWENIHPKSMPLILPVDDQECIEKWLDPEFEDVEYFEPLLEPRVRTRQVVTRIGAPSKWDVVGDRFFVEG